MAYSAFLPLSLAAVLSLAASASALDHRASDAARAPRQVSDAALVEAARALQRPSQSLAKAGAPLPSARVPGASASTASTASTAYPASAAVLGQVVPGPGIRWNASTGTPRFLDGRSLRRPAAALAKSSAASARAYDWFQANRDIFKLDDPARELAVEKEWTDGLGRRHAVFRQQYQGIPVWGREIGTHFDKAGELYAMNAASIPTPRLPGALGWKVGEARAVASVLADLSRRGEGGEMDASERSLLGYGGPEASKHVWIDAAGKPHWAWLVSVRPNFRDRWTYFVDGGTGAVLERYNATAFDGPATATANDQLGTARTLNTYKVGNAFYLIDATRKTWNPKSTLPQDPRGALWTLDAANTDLAKVNHASSANNTWADPAAVSAHYNMGRVFEYFSGTHNRLGIDGAGSTVISVVHVTAEGKKMDNAYWNGKCMAYGDGDKGFKPLARALDVAAHEMTHGVIEKTVTLEYKFQSGALNESLADVFGAMVDRDDWKIGEDVVNTAVFTSGALRDMQDPHNGGKGRDDFSWQPSHMNEFVQLNLDQDNGGVHVNSGIPNRAAFLVAQAIGREKTEKIYYRVLDAHYLNATSQFIDMRLAAVRAAADLHGEGSAEVAAVKSAFDAVGLTDKAGTERPKDAPENLGAEFVAIVNAEGGDQSLYVARPSVKADSDIVQLSPTQVYTKTGNPIAVTDDGSALLFIDSQNGLRIIEDDEQVVNASGNWQSVAISPDGSKVASTTVTPDAKIYILDLADPDASKAIDLYTPTTGSGVKVENVVNADALDWNSTGEYLLYDAFNRVPNNEGGAIEFWNVNVVDVKTGVITPFYPSLPEGVSIGNPSFAQNSDLNIVFDLYDANKDSYAVFAADLFTGEVGVIDSLGTDYGFPRYSTDDRTVVYERVESGSRNLVQAPMAADRITKTGASAAYIKGGQRPVWFAVGKRPAGIPFRKKTTPSGLTLAWDPLLGVSYGLPRQARVELSLRDMSGRLIGILDRGDRMAGLHRSAWDARPSKGVYLLDLRARLADGKTLKIARQVPITR